MITPLEITKAEYLEGYRLIVWFNDGAVKVVDLAGYLHRPHLAPLKEDEHIKRFQIALGTIEWEGEIDIAPEYLYNIAVDTLRVGNPAQWEWGEPYSEEALKPHFEDVVTA